jgi:hypothetical protein
MEKVTGSSNMLVEKVTGNTPEFLDEESVLRPHSFVQEAVPREIDTLPLLTIVLQQHSEHVFTGSPLQPSISRNARHADIRNRLSLFRVSA